MGNVFPAVMWSGLFARSMINVRFLASFGLIVYHTYSYVARCTLSHWENMIYFYFFVRKLIRWREVVQLHKSYIQSIISRSIIRICLVLLFNICRELFFIYFSLYTYMYMASNYICSYQYINYNPRERALWSSDNSKEKW